MANTHSIVPQQAPLLTAAALLQDVAELDFQAGRFAEAKEMAAASLQMNPNCKLTQQILIKISAHLDAH